MKSISRGILRCVSRHLYNVHRRQLSATQGGPPGHYYNSQLGQWIRISGAAGVRLHDVTAQSLGGFAGHADAFSRLVSMRPTSIELGKAPSLLEPGAAQDLSRILECATAAVYDKGRVLIAAGVGTQADIDAWAKAGNAEASAKMAVVEVAGGSDAQDVGMAVELVKGAKKMGMHTKARVLRCFVDEQGDTTDKQAVHDCVLALADAGTDVIILCSDADLELPGGREATDDYDVVEMLEACLWFDVSGESMMERLGFRGSHVSCVAASKLGLSHFETRAVAERGRGAFAADGHVLATALRDAGKLVHFDHSKRLSWA